MLQDMDRETALAELELKYTKGVISWLSDATSRSAAKADYEKLMLRDMDHAKALAELKLKYTKGVIDWLSSTLSKVDCTNKDLGLETTSDPNEIIVATCPKCGEEDSFDKDGTRHIVIPRDYR